MLKFGYKYIADIEDDNLDFWILIFCLIGAAILLIILCMCCWCCLFAGKNKDTRQRPLTVSTMEDKNMRISYYDMRVSGLKKRNLLNLALHKP